MIKYDFEILQVKPLRGHKISGTRDYETRVKVDKDGDIIFDEIVNIRKNKEGVFPDVEAIDRIKSTSVRKELTKRLKEYIKKAR